MVSLMRLLKSFVILLMQQELEEVQMTVLQQGLGLDGASSEILCQ